MRGRPALAAVLLAAGTFALYLPVREFSFLGYDDASVLVLNRHLRDGLTWEGVRWAFTTSYLSNWIPVTWISHLADVSLFGMDAGAHHLVNAALHALGAALLLLFLRQATGAPGKSAVVAALFAVHPLHVESVAWVTLRRDVLMGVFCFAALLAWVRHARGGSRAWYAASLSCFALGLMSKALLVPFPLLLLLLDWWPLGRFEAGPPPAALRAGLRRLFPEKVPFLLLSAAAMAVSYHAQIRGVVGEGLLPLRLRAMNAVASIVWYPAKALWPSGLAIFYPHPQRRQEALLALAALAAALLVTAAAVRLARRYPWAPVGWLWYLAAVLPALGLVQVGAQARADRYAYLPLVGLFVVAVWGLAELAARRRALGRLLPAAGLGAVAAYAAAATMQIGHWRDDFTVFRHALEVTRDNYVAHVNLGRAYLDSGRHEAAAPHLHEVLRIVPGYPEAHNNLGVIALREGRLGEAERQFRAGIASFGGLAYLHRNLGIVLARTGRASEAREAFRKALAIDAEDDLALMHLGIALLREGDAAGGIELLGRAVAFSPENQAARYNLGKALTDAGRLAEGEGALRAALEAAPRDDAAANTLGQNLAAQGRVAEALPWFRRAAEVNPGNHAARVNLARALALLGRAAEEPPAGGAAP